MLYRGIDKIEHRKPVKHYVQLFTGTVHTIQSSLVDDVVDLNAIEAPAVLAIEDVAEGEPEDIDDMVGNGGHRVDTSMSHRWGPFVFSSVIRGEATQWQVTCPLHKDAEDAAGTKCTKTLGFDGVADREEAAKILRHWCVKGFPCLARALGNNSHKSKPQGRQLRGMKRVSDEKLQDMLQSNLDLLQEQLDNYLDDNGPPPFVRTSDSSSHSDSSGDS